MHVLCGGRGSGIKAAERALYYIAEKPSIPCGSGGGAKKTRGGSACMLLLQSCLHGRQATAWDTMGHLPQQDNNKRQIPDVTV